MAVRLTVGGQGITRGPTRATGEHDPVETGEMGAEELAAAPEKAQESLPQQG
jgi:hypothetical protein